MKKVFYLILGLFLFIPSIVFASTTYNEGIDLTKTYIYGFQDYSRYIKLTGELPFEINSSNRPVINSSFVSGGFLNEKEYLMSIRDSASWLAPGIGYWLIGNKILDVRITTINNPVAVSGVRITEFVKHDAKVKGSGTKTNPWYFTDGYIVKVGSSDQTMGTVTGGCEHVPEGGSCTFTLSYDEKQGMNYDNCKKIVESKGSTLSKSGNRITISNVRSDINCFIDFGGNACLRVAFDNDGGSGGMTGKVIYYKYGYGWFNDSLCLSKVTNVSVPTKAGNRFLGYYINTLLTINENSKIAAGIKENITTNVTAKANWEPCGPGKHLNSSTNRCVPCELNKYSTGPANVSCTDCPTGYTTASTGSSAKSHCKITCGQDKFVKEKDKQCVSCSAGYHHDGDHTVSAGSLSPVCEGNTYYVHYNGNGNTGGSTANTSHIYGTPSNLRANGFTKTGYTFKGWATSSNGGVAYANQASVSTLTTTRNGTYELYAVWKDETPPVCTVTKSNIGTQNGVTFTVSCSDSGSGCPASSSFTRTGVKSTPTYVIYDNAGNSTTCKMPNGSNIYVRSYSCNPYSCNPYSCNPYSCDCWDYWYECGSYACGQTCGNPMCGNDMGCCWQYGDVYTTYCPSYCHEQGCNTCWNTCWDTCYNTCYD